MNRTGPNTNVGFTLVEIMIVVAVISILVLLVLPSLARARQSSMKQRCIENQRTIFEAAVRYEQDNSSSLQSIADQGGTIRDTLYNAGYVKNVSSFQCPASPQKGYNSSYILLYGSRNDLTNTGCYWYPAQHIYH